MEIEPTVREFDLISLAASCPVLTTRDDQYDFAWLLDAAHISRRRGGRFRLVDSGTNDCVSLVWLAEAGAHIYTSDEARPDPKDVIDIQRACRKGGSVASYYIYGPLNRPLFLDEAVELGRAGADFHLSNREHRREAGELLDLARACGRGRGRLVYYHHGRLEPLLQSAAEAGAWIHWSSAGAVPDQDYFLLKDILGAGRFSGAGLVIHLEEPWPAKLLGELQADGAFLRFHGPLAEADPGLAALWARAACRAPDFQADYLHGDFLP